MKKVSVDKEFRFDKRVPTCIFKVDKGSGDEVRDFGYRTVYQVMGSGLVS